MAMKVEQLSENRRVIFDDSNPRIRTEELRCHVCREWFNADAVTWATENGELTTHGSPYCDGCLPALGD